MRRVSLFAAAAIAAVITATTGVVGPTARAEVDPYVTPGEHTIDGRQWRTWCEPYSRTARCRTEIKVGGVWTFNNLTYLPSPRTLWKSNPLAAYGVVRGTAQWRGTDGKRWRTECDTAATGREGCRSYRYDGSRWVFNNIVKFGKTPPNLDALYKYRPPAEPKKPKVVEPPAPTNYSISKGPNASDRVILTYDDCPRSLSSFKTTVKAVADLGVALALFPTGDCIRAGRFDSAYARAHGHYVFNHSISHPKLTSLSYAGIIKQLGAPGVVTTYGRPPYGDYNATVQRAYAAVGMRIWMWNLDTVDYRGKSSSQLVGIVVGRAKKGDSVLMHMQWNGFNASTVKAMRDGLARRGIGVCRNLAPTPVKPAAVRC